MANKYAQFSKAGEARRDVYRKVTGAAKSCIRKRAHKTREAAIQFASRFPDKTRAYKCDVCLMWHLASV